MASASSSASSPKAIGRASAGSSACTEFLDDPALRTTTDRILARCTDHSARRRVSGAGTSRTLERLDALNICFSPINRPEDLFTDPHVLRPGGLVNNFNADGKPFRVPALPIEWNGGNIGEGLKVPPLGADTAAVRAEIDKKMKTPRQKHREARMTRIQEIYPADRVILREVGLRDGLQLVKKFPSTGGKQRWIRDEYAAGVRHFEVGSFLPAKTFPQFVDVRDVVATVASLPGAHGIALALTSAASTRRWNPASAEIASVVSATEEHSQANAHRSRESAIANVKRLCELRDATSTSRSSMRRSRWRWAARSPARLTLRK